MDNDAVSVTSHQSIEQLRQVKKSDLSEIKSFANPPMPAVRVLDACHKIQANINSSIKVDGKGNAVDSSWKAIKSELLANPAKLLETCVATFNAIGKDPVLDRHIREFRKAHLSDPEFTYERSMKCSMATAALHQWLNDIAEHEELMNSKK